MEVSLHNYINWPMILISIEVGDVFGDLGRDLILLMCAMNIGAHTCFLSFLSSIFFCITSGVSKSILLLIIISFTCFYGNIY